MAEMIDRKKLPKALRVAPGKPCKLPDAGADRTLGWNHDEAELAHGENLRRLAELQYQLYADRRFALLVVLQAIDGGGKDGTVRHVISAFNPQGCTVTSFKAPSDEELRHDFLWRIHRHVPPRGEIGVFNRSHYEDVLIVRVHDLVPKAVWSRRYDQINAFERMLAQSHVSIVKIFLHISKDEQKQRFAERLRNPHKQWKFAPADLEERKKWDDYRAAFEAALSKCSTPWAPWHVVPADHKWFRDFAVSQILVHALEALPLKFPLPTYDPGAIRLR